jgi:hypothetical protein
LVSTFSKPSIQPQITLKNMKFTLVAAIHYLIDHQLAPHEIINLDCWADEGYRLRDLAQRWEGFTKLEEPFEGIENRQFDVLFPLLAEHDLCLQFIDSYPVVDDWRNLRVMIMHRQTLQEALGNIDRCPSPFLARQAIATPLQRSNSGHSNLPLKAKNGHRKPLGAESPQKAHRQLA